MGRTNRSLKNALHSQQIRFKVSHAAQKARKLAGGPSVIAESEVNNVTGKGIMRTGVRKRKTNEPLMRKPTIPFLPLDTILLIGEGNFSFARSLARPSSSRMELAPLVHLPSNNITATAFDSEEDCYVKYPDAQKIVQGLREWGVEVLFGVDATKLEWNPALKGRRWSKIVWNFPHSGKGIDDQDRNILSNQTLILGFLRSAARFLRQGPIPSAIDRRKKRKISHEDEDEEEEMDDTDNCEIESSRGTILITLRNVPPYTLWDVPKLAKNPPQSTQGSSSNPRYIILRSFAFHREIWDGYEHRMTKGSRAYGTAKTGERGEDRTWEFCLKDAPDV